MSSKNKEFIFPDQLLNQIESCSNGGFLLFYFDQNGRVVPVPAFESQASALALISFAEKYCEAVSHFEIENMVNTLRVMGSKSDDISENFDEGEEN